KTPSSTSARFIAARPVERGWSSEAASHRCRRAARLRIPSSVDRYLQHFATARKHAVVRQVKRAVVCDRDPRRKHETLVEHDLHGSAALLAQQAPDADAGIRAGARHETARNLDDV